VIEAYAEEDNEQDHQTDEEEIDIASARASEPSATLFELQLYEE
jgi:hypothetical protein